MSLRFALLICAILVSVAPGCFAQDQQFGTALSEIASNVDMKCEMSKITLDVARTDSRSNRRDKAETIYFAELGRRMNCECIPRQIASLRSKISATDLKQTMSKAALNEKMKPYLGRCLAEQFQFTYGASCSPIFSKEIGLNPGFCQCMANKYAAMSDVDLADMASDASQAFERGVNARSKGLPQPEPTEWQKKSAAIEKACTAKE